MDFHGLLSALEGHKNGHNTAFVGALHGLTGKQSNCGCPRNCTQRVRAPLPLVSTGKAGQDGNLQSQETCRPEFIVLANIGRRAPVPATQRFQPALPGRGNARNTDRVTL